MKGESAESHGGILLLFQNGGSLGQNDVIHKIYWKDNRRFADLINVVLGGGKALVNADNLHNENIELCVSIGEDKEKKIIQKYRDVIKQVSEELNCFLIGIENQQEVHYAMPLRVMLFDALGYAEQVTELKKKHKEGKELSGSAEFLSGIKKGDRLKPICTIVLYYGTEPWDGPMELHDMLDMEQIPEEMRGFVVNYPMVLVDVQRFADWQKFTTDVRETFGFINHSQEAESLQQFLHENEEWSSNLDGETCDFLESVTGAAKLKEVRKKRKTQGGKYDMCKAIDDMQKNSWIEGEKAGRKAGERIGREAGERIGREAGERIGREVGERIGREVGKRLGREEGERLGREEGEKSGIEKMRKLLENLRMEDRLDEIGKALTDANYLEKLLNEFVPAQPGRSVPRV